MYKQFNILKVNKRFLMCILCSVELQSDRINPVATVFKRSAKTPHFCNPAVKQTKKVRKYVGIIPFTENEKKSW